MNGRTHYSPVPIPPAERWKRWRRHRLPAAVFVVSLVLLGWLWMRWVEPATLVAEVETLVAEVRSPSGGRLLGVVPELWQEVGSGQVLGQVVICEPEVAEASLAVLRAEADWLQASLRPVADQQRVLLEYERLHIEWMRQRIEAASLRVQLQRADSEVARLAPLRRSGLASEDDYEKAMLARDALAAQVGEHETLAGRLDPSIRSLDPARVDGSAQGPQAALRTSLRLSEEKLRLAEIQCRPVPLRAPLTGRVVSVLRRPGESVVSGEPVFRIAAREGGRLVGWIRQPLAFEPAPGMSAEVRSRGRARWVGHGTIEAVSPTMEMIPAAMLSPMRLAMDSVERGLRIHIRAPEGLALRPGEVVDVVLRP